MPGLGLYVTLKDVKGVKSITVVDTKVVPMTQGGKIGTSGVMGPYVPRKNSWSIKERGLCHDYLHK